MRAPKIEAIETMDALYAATYVACPYYKCTSAASQTTARANCFINASASLSPCSDAGQFRHSTHVQALADGLPTS
jgi:hypothetical protein